MTFIETIKIQYRRVLNLSYHNARLNRTRHEVLGIDTPLDLAEYIVLPQHLGRGIYKCRVTYDTQIRNVEFEKYQRRKIQSLKLVDGGDIDYRYKYADRSAIDGLYALRGDCDDILIVKDGLITDTSYANVALWDGREWYTPAVPLLEGTKRQQLIDQGQIKKQQISVADLPLFEKITLFNAMIEFNPKRTVKCSQLLH